MTKVSDNSRLAACIRRMFPLILALVACLIWVSAAQAQTPFDSQYDPPPTNPPECDTNGDGGGNGGGSGESSGGDFDPGVADSASGCDPAEGSSDVLSETDSPDVSLLPTTGGLGLAPFLLGAAIIASAGGIVAARRRN